MKDIFEIFYIEIFALIIILGLTEIVCVAISRKQGKMLAQGKYNPKEELKKSGEYQKVQNIFREPDKFLRIIISIFILIALVVAFLYIDVPFEKSIFNILDKNLNQICTISIGIATLVFATAVALSSFEKNYYLVFDKTDVLKLYHFDFLLIICFLWWVILCVVSIFEINNKSNMLYAGYVIVIEVSFAIEVLASCCIIFIVLKILFSNTKFELRILKELHRVFWINNINLDHMKDPRYWMKGTIFSNVEYLITRYIKYYRKVNNGTIKRMEFATSIGKYKKKWLKKGKIKYVTFISIFTFIVALIYFLNYYFTGVLFKNVYAKWGFFIEFLIIIITIIGVLLCPATQLMVFRFCIDTWGYYITWENGKEKFLPRVRISKNNKRDQYVLSLNNLLAFFYLMTINQVGIDECKYTIMITKKLLDNSSTKEKNIFLYLPLFVGGYFMFYNGVDIQVIKELYRDNVKNKEQEQRLITSIDSQIFGLMHNDIYYEDWEKKKNEYIIRLIN